MTRKQLIAGAVIAVGVVVALAAVIAVNSDGDGATSTSATSQRRPAQPGNSPTSTPGGANPPAGEAPTETRPEGASGPVTITDNSIQRGLIAREYLTVTPDKVKPGDKLPVVLVLHGMGVDRTQMLDTADWRGAVGRDRFVAVFPQGFANSWNVGPCCPPANLLDVDDMGFLDDVLARVKTLPGVDPERVYVTGFSAGAVMTYAVVCARPGVYAGMAPVGGSNILGCKPEKTVSLLHQHSDPDPVVPYNGGFGIGQILSSAALPSVPGSVADWAAADGCAAQPSTTSGPSGVERSTWGGCESGSVVELVRIPGLGHEWPKLGSYDGLEEILKFFDLE